MNIGTNKTFTKNYGILRDINYNAIVFHVHTITIIHGQGLLNSLCKFKC